MDPTLVNQWGKLHHVNIEWTPHPYMTVLGLGDYFLFQLDS